MSIIKSLQEWLDTYDGMEITTLTDTVDETAGSYALALAGTEVASIDILGKRTYRHSYVFYAREQVDAESDRAGNYDFIESFVEWIENQSDKEELPTLPGKYKSTGIEVSNAMLYDIYDDGTGLYQLQINLEFERT